MKKRFYFGLLPITALLFISWTLPDNKQYPPDVEAVLVKAGSNRLELEKALQYFQKRGDEQMLRATYFLISNMDIHYSETYNLKDSIGNRIRFCEQCF